MIFYVGSLKSNCFKKEDLSNSYKSYYGKDICGSFFEAKKINFIAFDNIKRCQKVFYENNEIGIYGDLSNAFFRQKIKKNDLYEKIANEYKENGMDFLKMLSGDFSFALIDYTKKILFLIRDQFGMKQIFWYGNGENIIFTNYLFSLKDYYQANVISKKYLEKYYNNNGLLDFNITPYKNVYRVNASSYVKLNKFNVEDEFEEVKYWDISDMQLEKEEKWIDKIDSLIESSVDKRYKDKIGIMLSGGLDSTALFTYYAELKETEVEGFSAVFEELKSCDERIFIDELVKMYQKKEFNYVNCDDTGILEGYPKKFFFTSEPHVNIINKALCEKLFVELKNKGFQYVVDGFFADHIFSGSIFYVMDYIISRQYIKAIKAIRAYAETRNKSIWKVLSEEIIPIRKKRIFGISDDVIKENFHSLDKIKKYNNIDMVIQIRSTIARNFADFELAPRYGIECIHPYIDVELVESLYAIPGEFKCQKGVYKEILRKIAKNKLPESIIQREVKTTHVELSQKGLRDNWANIYNILGQGRICKLEFLSLTVDEWKKIILQFRNGESFNDKIWILLSMEIWLHQAEMKYGLIEIVE